MLRVLKFGSSVLRSERDLPVAVAAIAQARATGHQVLAVVSALGETTDELLRRAESLGPAPRSEATAALLAAGETVASALLALALHHAGIPVILLDPAESGLLTTADPLAADPLAVDASRLRRAAAQGAVVLPGFAGRDREGRTTLLGRGGSDLTAAFLAHALGCVCVLYKDTDGICTSDPNCDPAARRFARASYATAIAVGGGVVQKRALRFAEERGLELHVAAPRGGEGTWIGPWPDRLAAEGSETAAAREEMA